MTVDRTCPLCSVDRGSLVKVVLGSGKTLTLACGQCAVAMRPFLAMLRAPRGEDPDAIRGMDSFVLRIALGNDAMRTSEHVYDALVEAASSIGDIADGGRLILDGNGNTVGSWAFHLRGIMGVTPGGGQDEQRTATG